jgi:hypothetical protein
MGQPLSGHGHGHDHSDSRALLLINFTEQRSPLLAALMLTGLLVAAIGISVLIGWHLQIALLLKWSPQFMPTGYMTALGFLVSGSGMAALAQNRHRAAVALGVATLLLGCVALSLHLFDFDPGLGLFLDTEDLAASQLNPGRTSLNSSLSLIIVGAALLIAAKNLFKEQSLLVLGMLGALVIAFSLAVVFGHLRGLERAYGWSQGTRTGVVSITGFMLIGAGILALAWHNRPWQTVNTPQWMAALSGLGIFLLSIVLWQALSMQEHAQIDQNLEAEVASLGREITPLVQSRITSLERIARYQGLDRSNAKYAWETESALHIGSHFDQTTIGWLNRKLDILAVLPPEQEVALLLRVVGCLP